MFCLNYYWVEVGAELGNYSTVKSRKVITYTVELSLVLTGSLSPDMKCRDMTAQDDILHPCLLVSFGAIYIYALSHNIQSHPFSEIDTYLQWDTIPFLFNTFMKWK